MGIFDLLYEVYSRSIIKILLKIIKSRGYYAWVTGGALRDLFLGLIPIDLDLVIFGDAIILGRELSNIIGGHFVLLKESKAACRIVLDKNKRIYIDLMNMRSTTLEGDLRARDFTINAIALSLDDFLANNCNFIDPTGGMIDLEARSLRLAGSNSLEDDPLRVLRAFRFIATFDLILSPDLVDKLQAAGTGLFRVARERVGYEWRKLMSGSKAGLAIFTMERLQILTRLIPEMAPGRGVWQNPFHHLTILDHNLASLEALEQIFSKSEDILGDLASEVGIFRDNEQRRWQLKTAALWHDLGKPATRQNKGCNWFSFYGHDLRGASLAVQAGNRLGLSKGEISAIALLIREHMRPFHLLDVHAKLKLSRRAVRRLLIAVNNELAGIFLLGLADTMAGRGPERPPGIESKILKLWYEVKVLYQDGVNSLLEPSQIINGNDLISKLGLEPGPEIGRLLKLVRAAQMEGKVKNIQEALSLARYLYYQ